MESVELCARLSRFLRTGGDSAGSLPSAGDDEQRDVRATLDDIVAFYAGQAPTTTTSVPGVDDMMLVALQRLLLTTIRDYDSNLQERAFAALRLLLQRCHSRLPPARVVDLLQTCVLYLPTPSAAVAAAPAEGSAPPSDSSHASEELRMLVLYALDVLLSASAAASSVQMLTTSQDHVHFLAYAVSSLLQLAERQRNRELAALAIHVLVQLLNCVALPHVLRQFFPGVSVGMWKVVNAPLQSSKVIVAAVACLFVMVSRCFGGATTTATKNNNSNSQSAQFSLDRLRELQSVASSTPTVQAQATSSVPLDPWVDSSADKVDLLLWKLLSSKVMVQQPWRVRLAVVELCNVVVLECRWSLSGSFFPCFEELMVLSKHAIPEVARVAHGRLDQLTAALSLDEWLSLEPRFAERFHIQLSTLTVKASTEHEIVGVHLMDVLIGYLHFQKEQRFQHVLDDAMPSIYKSLCQIVAFDSLDVDLLRHEHLQLHQSSEDTDSDVKTLTLPYFQKRFRYFQDESSVAAAMRLLHSIGATATPAVVVDTAFSFLQATAVGGDENEHVQREAVLVVLNECLRARVGDASTQDNVHLVGRILDDLLALPFWSSSRGSSKNTVALMVECVGICVELVGQAFGGFLLDVLYSLVEKLGDPATQIERAAMTTLQKIAFYCGYHVDLHALFSANMDYFVDALCARLEHLEMYPQSPQVVEALLRHASVASLPLVHEITRSLLRAIDSYQNEPQITTALLRSLQLLLESFAQQQSGDGSEREQQANQKTKETTSPPLTRFMLEMQAWTDPLHDNMVENEDEAMSTTKEIDVVKGAMPIEYDDDKDGDGDEENQDDKDPSALPFQAQTVEILDRCSYFLADADPLACCLVLATIDKGVRYLRARRKELLPLIHRLWPSILHRLSVTNRPILTATMQLLTTLAECAGDFIGDRFVETVWPLMRSLLESICEACTEKQIKRPSLTRAMLQLSVGGASRIQEEKEGHLEGAVVKAFVGGEQRRGRLTLDLKLLEAALVCLHGVCEHAISVTSLVPDITRSCAQFLDPRFPETVVSLTETVLLALGTLNGDEVFVAMASLGQWQPPPPPSSRFPTFHSLDPAKRDPKDERLHGLVQCQANAARVLERLMART